MLQGTDSRLYQALVQEAGVLWRQPKIIERQVAVVGAADDANAANDTVDNILGQVTLDGEAGIDALIVIDEGDTSGDGVRNGSTCTASMDAAASKRFCSVLLAETTTASS